jgi:ring-1,2-phenylacetyl-CoA epoxidase subunit PaaD
MLFINKLEMPGLTTTQIYQWLEEVKDPEIPVLSLVDLGVITGISIQNTVVKIEMTPTFVGCPALDMMKDEIIERLNKEGILHVEIEVNYRSPWSSDRISQKGREALKKFGLAPPPYNKLIEDLEVIEHPACPRCQGTDTDLKNTFGSTLCRSIYYCNTCREAFEQFKAI